MTTRTNSPRRRFAGVLRVSAFVSTVCLLGGALALARTRARADELLLEAGAQMMFYARATRPVAEQTLELNGQTIHLRVNTTRDSADAVLDHFAERCRARDGMAHAAGERAGLLDGVLRTPRGPEGAVACLDVGQKPMAAAELAARLRAFVATGDLSRVGAPRFAHAKQLAEGHTLIVTSWVEGSLPLATMFPIDTDAPGYDAPGLPRPTGALRSLSARTAHDGAVLNSYRKSAGNATDEALAYRNTLIGAGFTVPELPPESRERELGFTAVRRGLGVVVSVRNTADDALEITTITLR